MVVIRFANLLVVIFRENDQKSHIFAIEDLFFFVNFFLEYFHLFQHKKLPKKLSLETFRVFFLTVSVYMTIYQDMFRKTDLELEIFNRRGPIFFTKSVF